MKIKGKVLIVGKMLHEVGLQRLKEEVEEVVEVPKLDVQELLTEVSDAVVLYIRPIAERSVVRSTTTKLIEQGPKLEALAVSAHVFDLVDTQAAASRHLPILYSKLEDHSVAELSIALMLCAARKIQYLAQEFRAERFRYEMRHEWAGEELYAKTVGIIGLGQIGRCLAQICKFGFNMRVLAYSPHVEGRVARDLGVDLVDKLSRLLEESDFVCLCTVHTDETRHMIGPRELGQMKHSAYLINTTPGLVDEKALIQALESGNIAGAGLDVFDPDPPDDPENPLFRFPNVAVMPHMGGYTKVMMRRAALDIAESIIAFLRGQTPNCIEWP